jgi:hypothetical protein
VEKHIDQLCLDLVGKLFSGRGPIWRAPVVLNLKVSN